LAILPTGIQHYKIPSGLTLLLLLDTIFNSYSLGKQNKLPINQHNRNTIVHIQPYIMLYAFVIHRNLWNERAREKEKKNYRSQIQRDNASVT